MLSYYLPLNTQTLSVVCCLFKSQVKQEYTGQHSILLIGLPKYTTNIWEVTQPAPTHYAAHSTARMQIVATAYPFLDSSAHTVCLPPDTSHNCSSMASFASLLVFKKIAAEALVVVLGLTGICRHPGSTVGSSTAIQLSATKQALKSRAWMQKHSQATTPGGFGPPAASIH